MPRLDYSGGASCPALLLEPQRTNTTSNSEYFAGGYLANTTLTSNTTTSPDGKQNASTIVSSTSSLQPKLLRFIGTAAGASEDQTFSLFVKKYNHRYIQLINEGDADSYANFDIEDGVVGNYGSGTTASIEDYGNGWYRCTIVLDSSHTIAANNRIYLVHSLTQGYANASNVASGDGVYIWGAMQENNSSYPTSYIPTYGASVTRSSENVPTDMTLNYGNKFSALFDLNGLGGSVSNNFIIRLGSTNPLYLSVRSSDKKLQFYSPASGVGYFATTATQKIAISCDGTNWIWSSDGASGTLTATGAVNAEYIKIKTDGGAGGGFPAALVNQIVLFETALTADELNSLTA